VYVVNEWNNEHQIKEYKYTHYTINRI
jgi:hypothetical protein